MEPLVVSADGSRLLIRLLLRSLLSLLSHVVLLSQSGLDLMTGGESVTREEEENELHFLLTTGEVGPVFVGREEWNDEGKRLVC